MQFQNKRSVRRKDADLMAAKPGPVRRPEPDPKICPCGRMFIKKAQQSFTKWVMRKFCSPSCAGKYGKELKDGDKKTV